MRFWIESIHLKQNSPFLRMLGMFSIAWVGMVLWLVYGLLLGSWALILCNGTTLVFAGYIIACKLRYG